MTTPKYNLELDSMPNIQKKSRPQTAFNRPMPTSPSTFYGNSKNNKNGVRKMPQISQPTKNMGLNCEKEELYEETMQLKRTVNRLRKELAETKSAVVKTELNLRKKEKIIEDLSKENDVEEIKQENIKKAKESTIVALVKKKYNELKDGYKSLQEENEVLKANAKITKIKEIQIETEVLLQEMKKIKSLYLHSQEQNKTKLNQLSDYGQMREKFIEQHQIIKALQSNYEDLKKQNREFSNQVDTLRDKIIKKDETIRKQKISNQKLQAANDTYLNEKKSSEKYKMNYNEYQIIMNDLQKKCEKLESDYKQKEIDCINQRKMISDMQKRAARPINPTIKEFNNETIKHIEVKQQNVDSSKNELLRSLLKDYKLKCSIYEKVLIDYGKNPDEVLKQYGYEGVLNSKSPNVKKNSSKNFSNSATNNKATTLKSNEENKQTTSEEYMNIDETNPNNVQQPNENQSIHKLNENDTNNKKSSQTLSGQNRGKSDTETNAYQDPYEDEYARYVKDFNVFMYVVIKNLEAKLSDKEELKQKANDIYQTFVKENSEQEQPTQEQFIEPFVDLLLESSGSSKSENDHNLVFTTLMFLMENFENDTSQFIEFLYSMFEQITDYKILENQKESSLKATLMRYKDKLLPLLDNENNKFMEFIEFKEIFDTVIKDMNDEDFNFLMFKMKQKALEQKAELIELDTKYINELIGKKPRVQSSKLSSKIDEEQSSMKKSSKIEEKKNEDESSSFHNESSIKQDDGNDKSKEPFGSDGTFGQKQENVSHIISENPEISNKQKPAKEASINESDNKKEIIDDKITYDIHNDDFKPLTDEEITSKLNSIKVSIEDQNLLKFFEDKLENEKYVKANDFFDILKEKGIIFSLAEMDSFQKKFGQGDENELMNLDEMDKIIREQDNGDFEEEL